MGRILDRLFRRRRRNRNSDVMLEIGEPQAVRIFDTTAVNNTTIPFDRFMHHVMRQPFSKSLWRATDLETAREMAESLWERYVDPLPGASPALGALTEANIDAKTAEFKAYIDAQTQKAIANEEKIRALFTDAQRGSLRRHLRANTDDETDTELFLNITPGKTRSARQRRPNELLDIAVDWIIRSSSTLHNTVTQTERLELRGAVERVVVHQMDVFDLETLRFLFTSCGKKEMLERYTLIGAFYGDTVIGRYLHRLTLEQARNVAALTNVNPDFWLDVALATLSGLIIAHGFADSNGRSARALYAAMLLQNWTNGLMLDRRPFIAPDYRWLVNFVQPTRDWHGVALP
ncbi:MAG: hypothetical protein AAF899_01935 [Pseudomonadota bacterium]